MDQISIFDFPEWLPEEDFQTMTSKRAAEIVGDRLGVKFKLYERYFENYFKAKKDGFEITIGFSVGFDGNRFLDTEVDHGSSCYGNPARSIDDCVDSIKSYIEKESKKEPTEVQREPKKVNIKGLMNYGYCPDCGGCNEDLEEECRYCGCLLDWSEWKRLEGMEDQ